MSGQPLNAEGITGTADASSPDDGPPDNGIEAVSLVDRRIDIVVCSAVFLLGLALFVLSSGIRQGSIPDPIGPDGWPKLLGATLMLTMGVNIVRRLLSWRASPDHMVASDGGKDDVAGLPGTFIRPALVLLTALAWVLVVHWSGFILATAGLLLAVLVMMKVRKPAKLVLVPVLFTLIAWLLFGAFFGIRLPAGPVEQALIEIVPGLK